MKKIILLLFFLVSPYFIFSQWGYLNSGWKKNINSIEPVDSLTVYAVGDSGLIYKTTNGGTSWISQNSGYPDEKLTSVFFISNQIGFITGSNGLLLSTNNFGLTWQKKTISTSMNLNDIYFINATVGFIVGENGLIYRTDDSGNSWNELNIVTTFFLNAIHFPDEQNGFITGSNGTLLKTNDGGLTWAVMATQTNQVLNDVFFINKDTGFVAGLNQTLLKTMDGANSFTPVNLSYGEHFYSIECIETEDCYITGNKETIIKIDKQSQSTLLNGGGTKTINTIRFYNSYIGYTAGTNGMILKTCPVSDFIASSYTLNLNSTGNVTFTNQSRNNTNGTWFFGDGASSTEKNPAHKYTAVGDYKVELITENQSTCKDTISKFIKVINTQGIEDEIKLNAIQIFPNPFKDKLTIELNVNNRSITSLEVITLTGESIYKSQLKEKSVEKIFSGSELKKLPSGIYFLRIETAQNIFFRKVIKL